ncbi:MAG: phosphate acyltransferase PlsX [Chitinophagaceae bacterium]
MHIGIDMMGGDFAPIETIKGIQLYFSGKKNSANLVLIGNKHTIENLVKEYNLTIGNFSIVHADQVIDMYEHPAKALKEKPRSSIAIGLQLLASDKIDAFISAGNSGAMLVGALYTIKALQGVIRPAISSIIPKADGGTGLLLDVGLNADCKPEHLNQFAIMGTVYARLIMGTTDPKTGLINVGEEEGKGNLLSQATFKLLKENLHIKFIGNIEGRDILQNKADVMVCEGFTGNIILKMAESLYEISQKKNVKDEYFDRFNFEIYGGTPILGVSKPVIIGHGISTAKAFMNMIQLAQNLIEKDMMQKMKDELS